MKRLLILAIYCSLAALDPVGASFASAVGPTVIVVPGTPADGAIEADGADLTVRLDDVPRDVLEVEPAADWSVVIAIDPALSSAATARTAAELLAAQAERLTALGEVSIVVVDRYVDEILTPTRSSEELVRNLASLPRAGTFDEIASRRAAIDRAAAELDRLAAARDELEVIRWQREALVDWLIAAQRPGPKALFVIQDAYKLDQVTAYGLSQALPGGTPSPVTDNRLLGPALAAAQWISHPLQLGGTAPEGGAAPGAIAAETGGRLIQNGEDLDRALAALEGAAAVTIDMPLEPSGPRELTVAAPWEVHPPRWAPGAFAPGLAAAHARRFLNEDEQGGLEVEALIYPEGPDPDSVFLEVRVDLDAGRSLPSSAWLSMALYLDQLQGPPIHIELQGGGGSLAGTDRWVGQVALVLPQDPGELVAVVTDATTGRWGASRVEEEGLRLLRRGPGLLVEQYDLRPVREAAVATEGEVLITLLAPRGAELKGQQRFRTLVTRPIISRVVFYLDGEVAEEDVQAPFGARIDLGEEVARHTVRVEAFDGLGELIGSDSIRLNEPTRSFDVTIGQIVQSDPTGESGFDVAVSHPTDIPVERVEFYFNERLLETRTSPPWSVRATLGELGATDYVRAVAYFENDSFLEDVRLLSSLGTAEQVEVNLVQVYVVATDKQGDPVADLTADDFEIRLRGKVQQIDRFAYAEEVPLKLGLLVDTSGSMYSLMPSAKQAAGRFLMQIMSEKDEGLVVDFDNEPRLVAPLSDDVGDLVVSLGTLAAERDSSTALYDSVIFGALQLPAGQERKALVLLTDGRDYGSRFSLGRAIDTAKQSGVPVYVVSLAGLHDLRQKAPRPDIKALTAPDRWRGFLPRTDE